MNKYIKTLPINLNTSLSQSVYFFSNKNIDNNIYLCQQCNSIENALFIIDVWNKYKYNIGVNDSFINELTINNRDINIEQLETKLKNNNSFNLSKQEYHKSDYIYYIYVSDIDIREKIVGNGDENYKLIVYKKDNILHYIALLFYKEITYGISHTHYLKEDEKEDEDEKEVEDEKEKEKRERESKGERERERERESKGEREKEREIEKKGKLCNITGLKYKGNSCYQDSVLLALLAIPNEFINEEIVNKDMEKISNDDKRDIKCSEYSNLNDKIRRNKIKKELIKIMNSMRNNDDRYKVETCSMLREYIKDCPSIGGQAFHGTSTQDAGEFLIYLFTLFNINNVTEKKIINIVSNDIENDVYSLKNYVLISERTEYVSPIINIHSNSLIDTKIDFYLNMEDDIVFDSNNLYRDRQTGELYKRKITKDSIQNSDYLIFQIQRLTFGNERLYYEIIPSEYIILPNKKKLYLHAIVTHKKTHYTCYIKCNNSWFFYNDMRENIEYIGKYDDMFIDSDRPNPSKMGILYFYSL
jgi:hypothetical protein